MYMCFKIGDYKSILEKIFIKDLDKLSVEEFHLGEDVDIAEMYKFYKNYDQFEIEFMENKGI